MRSQSDINAISQRSQCDFNFDFKCDFKTISKRVHVISMRFQSDFKAISNATSKRLHCDFKAISNAISKRFQMRFQSDFKCDFKAISNVI